MCGIVGYVGQQQAAPILIEGLGQLEYRGYDSAGVAVMNDERQAVARQVGRVRQLVEAMPVAMPGSLGIGHTRWATHGPPAERNAHPHTSTDGRVCVVHNGIIDNASVLRSRLSDEGVQFTSDTDTEVLAHLISRSSLTTLEERVLHALDSVVGTYAIAVTDVGSPGLIVVARNGSPLVLGVGEQEMFVASDVSAMVRHTSTAVHLEDGDLAAVTATGYRTFSREQSDTQRAATHIDLTSDDIDLGDHQHFMAKEIAEQPTTVARMLRGRLDTRLGTARLDGLNLSPRELRAFRRVKILGCGSAYYMGEMGALIIEDLARVPAHAEAASEFRYRNPIIEPDTLYVAMSQSGETADTAFAVREIKAKGGQVVGLVNVVGSQIARECSGGIYLHSGPEVSVASTKATTHMAVGLAMLGLLLGRVRDLSVSDGQRIIAGLQRLPDDIAALLATESAIVSASRTVGSAESLFFVGRVRGYPVAREGAQKLKEVTYQHAEAYQTSELKHGPIALIEASRPTLVVVPDDDLVGRNRAAIEQILARGGPVVALTHPEVDLGQLDVTRIDVPSTEPELAPILLMIATQVVAYHAAVARGLDVDKPRNLAKSVTVE